MQNEVPVPIVMLDLHCDGNFHLSKLAAKGALWMVNFTLQSLIQPTHNSFMDCQVNHYQLGWLAFLLPVSHFFPIHGAQTASPNNKVCKQVTDSCGQHGQISYSSTNKTEVLSLHISTWGKERPVHNWFLEGWLQVVVSHQTSSVQQLLSDCPPFVWSPTTTSCSIDECNA